MRSTSLLVLFMLPLITASSATGQDSSSPLTRAQMQSVLDDANQAYRRAQSTASSDQAESRESFELATNKYQLLVDSGLSNARLFLNLGNSRLQLGQLGHAIANYHRAVRLDPTHEQAKTNLEFVEKKLLERTTAGTAQVDESAAPGFQSINGWVVNAIGRSPLQIVLAIASVLFWGVLIVRATGVRFPAWRFAAAPLLILICTSAMLGFHSQTQNNDSRLGIVVVKTAELRAGDGNEFEANHSLESCEGHEVAVLARRGDWLEIATNKGQRGWLSSDEVIAVD